MSTLRADAAGNGFEPRGGEPVADGEGGTIAALDVRRVHVAMLRIRDVLKTADVLAAV